jgi:3-phytase
MTGPWRGCLRGFGLVPAVLVLLGAAALAAVLPTVTPRMTLTGSAADDQDDMCIWIHPSDAALSAVITSDKGGGRLFVYDLLGNVLQNVSFPGEPGNIDLRYGFPFGSNVVDIVCVNDRSANRLLVYAMDAVSRHLARIDDGDLAIGASYGLGLYRSPLDGAFHVFVTTESGAIRQYELSGAGGHVARTLVRSWSFSSQTESCVCDDETGFAYFGEEDAGIWKVGAEPGDATPGTRIAQVGDGSGLVADVEGLAIYYAAGGGGYLLASAQGSSSFVAYDRAPPHAPALHFDVAGVGATDGVDVTNVPLGPDFPYGIFAVHDDTTSPKAVQVCAYEDLGLAIDTGYWGPRGGPAVAAPRTAPGGAGLRIDSSPNPARDGTRIRFTLAEASTAELLVVDAAGRAVRRLLEPRPREAGVHAATWDGRDDAGHAVPAGVYFCRLSTGRGEATAKVALVR